MIQKCPKSVCRPVVNIQHVLIPYKILQDITNLGVFQTREDPAAMFTVSLLFSYSWRALRGVSVYSRKRQVGCAEKKCILGARYPRVIFSRMAMHFLVRQMRPTVLRSTLSLMIQERSEVPSTWYPIKISVATESGKCQLKTICSFMEYQVNQSC